MTAEPGGRGRRTPWGLLLALAMTAGCAPPSTPSGSAGGTAIVVFVDFSQSVSGEDLAAFRREVEREILSTLGAGDRLLIAPIHDRTLTGFRPLIDATLPAKPGFSGWMDNVLTYNRQAKEFESHVLLLKDKVATEVARVFTQRPASPHTDIMNSLLIAEQLFHDEPRRKVLVLMSDMIEDSPSYRFEQIAWSPATVDKMLADLGAKGLIPRLPGVCVYVSGVSARSAELAQQIGRFWHAYFRRTGADMDPARYAHVLLHWPPANACRAPGAPRAI
jgi:hypothetical protein